jgi:hypothetical protein
LPGAGIASRADANGDPEPFYKLVRSGSLSTRGLAALLGHPGMEVMGGGARSYASLHVLPAALRRALRCAGGSAPLLLMGGRLRK